MNKWILLIIGVFVLSGTVMADCGACDAVEEAQAIPELKEAKVCEAGVEKSSCAGKAVCKDVQKKCDAVKDAGEKATCELKAAKACGEGCEKPCCATEAAVEQVKKQCAPGCAKPCCATADAEKTWQQKLMFWKK